MDYIDKVNVKGTDYSIHDTQLRNTVDQRISELQSYIGINDSTVPGILVDFKNSTFARLSAAKGLNGGSDFDKFKAFGGRRRCNLSDDGTVNAYYGDAGYKEDGSNGQVMVEQPRFYYLTVPIEAQLSPTDGYILRKAAYYISDTPRTGFKIYPAFNVNGKKIDNYYEGAFEGTLYDVSASQYIKDDAQVADFATDKMASVSGGKPISGSTQNLTRDGARKLCHNRGSGWQLETIQIASADQLLMLVEYGKFDMQSAIGSGNVYRFWIEDGINWAGNTGATTSLGNKSGIVQVTVSGQKSGYPNQILNMVSYRGKENPWGNIWKWIDGLNMYKTEIYIADHDFKDDTGSSPYEYAGFKCSSNEGYVSAFCYSQNCDWLFVPAETKGNSSVPVGDYFYVNPTYGWLVARLGASWYDGAGAGAFYLDVTDASGFRYRDVSGRPVYRKIK